jgi:streptogramin lyase
MAPNHSPIVTSDPATPTVSAFHGRVHGGQAPIAGSQVYLYSPATGGYGGLATSLLNSHTGNPPDSSGHYYVLTDSTGGFTIPANAYACTAGTQVYLFSVGGNPQIGGGANSAIGLMAVLGTCGANNSFANLPPSVQMNEATTIAAAYAFAAFNYSPVQMSGKGGSPGMANAALTAANLVNLGTGDANTTTPAGNGTVPQTEINTLANILAACVNSSGPSSTACTTLFTNAPSNPAPPTNTATAAINIAHVPGANVTALWDLETPTAPFQPSLTTSTPNDWTIAIAYTGGGLNGPTDVAVDATGDVWVTNNDNNSIGEFSPVGAALSPAGGYTGGGVTSPNSLAIDQAGNIWITNQGTTTISKYVPGTGFVGTGFTGGGLNNPWGLAIDPSGNVWVANLGNNSISEFNSSGTAFSSTGYTGGGLNDPIAIAIDPRPVIWVANHGNGSISEFFTSGVPISPSGGITGGGTDDPLGVAIDSSGNIWFGNEGNSVLSEFDTNSHEVSGTGFAGGGLNVPYGVAVDGLGNVWTANFSGASISEFYNSGTAISSGTGYQGTLPANLALANPEGLAIDPSGNVWVANDGNDDIIEVIGAATPVVTPLSVALKNNELGARP